MTKIVILAAGKGKRMGLETPKVLVALKGRPIIKYLLDSVVSSQVDSQPIIVISPEGEKIMRENLQDYSLDYALQTKQLGTGHAVASAEKNLSSQVDKVLVLYGDHPFISSQSIKNLINLDFSGLAIMPTVLSDFNDWRQNFYHWGRIIRNENKEVEKIVEFKDASDQEKRVLEVNPGIMAFNRDWLFANLEKLNNNNKQQEYYLTDMVKLAFKQGLVIKTIKIEPEEAIGINSRAELKVATKLL